MKSLHRREIVSFCLALEPCEIILLAILLVQFQTKSSLQIEANDKHQSTFYNLLTVNGILKPNKLMKQMTFLTIFPIKEKIKTLLQFMRLLLLTILNMEVLISKEGYFLCW